nr:ATP-dependent DNA helicase [Candidatus Korarchaeota archaeon]
MALSATIKNVQEVAEWLKADYVATEWRPVPLREGVVFREEVQFKDGDARRIERKTRDPNINLVLETIKLGGQALVFANTRRRAVALAKKATKKVDELLSKPLKRSLKRDAKKILAAGERTRLSELLAGLVEHGTAFHHAGLGSVHRKIVEDSFRNGKI